MLKIFSHIISMIPRNVADKVKDTLNIDLMFSDNEKVSRTQKIIRPFLLYYLLFKNFIRYNKSINYFRKLCINSKPIWELDCSKYKKSDTVFILGSGSSINSFSNSDWSHIMKQDSIGINFWLIHDFIPTFLIMELPSDEKRRNIFYELIKMKYKKYSNVPFILKDIIAYNNYDLKTLSIINHLYVSVDYVFQGSSIQISRNFLHYFKNSKFICYLLNKRYILLKRSSTINLAILLSFFMGYKNIVLCGIDLNNTNYFYDDEKNNYNRKGIPIPETGQKGVIHNTMDCSIDIISVDELVYAINDGFLKPCKVKLFIASDKSALYPTLPLYEFT